MNKNYEYENEKTAAMAIINADHLRPFLYMNADVEVGVLNGRPTTLREEVGEVARLAHKAYVGDGVNYFHSRTAYAIAEYSEEEQEKRSQKLYRMAASKILWLNSKSKELGCDGFLSVRVDKTNTEDTKKLVDAFEWIVRHFSEV